LRNQTHFAGFWYRLTSSEENREDSEYQNPAEKICCEKSRSHLTPGARNGRPTEKTKFKMESNAGHDRALSPLCVRFIYRSYAAAWTLLKF